MHRDLLRSQKALDRQRMEHDKAELEWRDTRGRERNGDTPGASKLANGLGHATPNGDMDEVRPPSLLPLLAQYVHRISSRVSGMVQHLQPYSCKIRPNWRIWQTLD